MNTGRGWLPAGVLGGATALLLACSAQGVPSAQDAVKAFSTSAAGAPSIAGTAVAAVQTAAPQAQGAVSELQAILQQASAAYGNLRFDVTQNPPNVPPDQVTRVTVVGRDPTNGFQALDQPTKQAAGLAALIATAQQYPNAAVELRVEDSQGGQVLTATKQPTGLPVVTVAQ